MFLYILAANMQQQLEIPRQEQVMISRGVGLKSRWEIFDFSEVIENRTAGQPIQKNILPTRQYHILINKSTHNSGNAQVPLPIQARQTCTYIR